ncbi:MAG: DNA-directed RNA polymerase subunit beta' [Deltaproteobacteria bacterium]|nr:DNA-directed RNA polymerase subunit beta' [Deltaproteobacteria bacterium]
MKDLYNLFEKPKNPLSFNKIRIGLASPETVRKWSHGEVKKPETINYRTFKPERGGLFCAKIFGPIKDYECLCGKYKRIKHRGIVCEKCGVEVIQSKVRRERLAHIELATPVAHIWFVKSVPSRIGTILDISPKSLERVLYFENYVVVDPGDPQKTGLQEGKVLTEDQYRKLVVEFGGAFDARMGAEAVRLLLSRINLPELSQQLRAELKESTSVAKTQKLTKRLKVVEAFLASGNRPEWMILECVPVLPPELRPLVPLEGGRFATSDLNDLYRRVINRNNRLLRLMQLNAPEIIIRNEKRMLQESVDALFDNGRRGKTITGANKRPLKSLSDMLKGKQGRFRQNLLGKRVDYSGRSVIVVGPELKLHQCGLPKRMALELFKPFVYNRLEKQGHAATIKAAKKMVEREESVVWDILDDVVKEHPVMLNRAPTLHRLGIQAFEPVLIEGKAIQLHPLVCTAFNADFDGDQMAVHVPLSIEAQIEARVLMMSTNNILSPASGKPIIVPTQDIVLGLYYLTRERAYARGEGRVFSSPEEVRMAYDAGEVDLQAAIGLRLAGQRVQTTVGRVVLWEILPQGTPFSVVNKVLDKKATASLIDVVFRSAGDKATVILADRLKNLGYSYATRAGIAIAVKDMRIPAAKPAILEDARKQVLAMKQSHEEGIVTDGERRNHVVDICSRATEMVKEEMMKGISTERLMNPENPGEFREVPSLNPIFIMADSGARGSQDQIKQLAGMRGLMAKPSGEIIETPIEANFREGLTVLEYFVSTHGARKGLADTALKTANSGYLTRRLVDVAQDSIISEHDCFTMDGIEARSLTEGGEVIEQLGDRILGRVALEDVVDPASGKLIVQANAEITEALVKQVEEAGIESVKIRSVLTCQAKYGICQLCYGRDLARGHLVNLGEAVGVIAAQSIGEPGTQLTMRTFHFGGAATRRAEQSHVEARGDGKLEYHNISFVTHEKQGRVMMNRNGELVVKDSTGRERERYKIPYGSRLLAGPGEEVKRGTRLADWDAFAVPLLTDVGGIVKFGDIIDGVTMTETTDEQTAMTTRKIIETRASADHRPRVSIKDPGGATLTIPGSSQQARYFLPVGSILTIKEGDVVMPGDPIAKIPRESAKTKDITGGLPRVAELFEARKPRELAIISEIDGYVTFGKDTKGKRKLIVTARDSDGNQLGEPREYLVPRGKHITVQQGDYVRAGEAVTDGNPNPHDILAVLGEKELAKFLVDGVQEVYRLQGVKINDKHIESIVRQIMRKVEVNDPGDTPFLKGDRVEKWRFQEVNQQVIEKGGKPASADLLLLGITKASLATESFISAASFQETTRVLTDASINGRVDLLRGLKENVIMGRLIPAGTGNDAYRTVDYDLLSEQEEGAGGDIPLTAPTA